MNNIKELHFNKSELISILLLGCIFFQILLVGSQPNIATPNANQPLNEEVLIDSLRGNTLDKFTSDSSSINERSEPQIQEHNQEIESNHTLNYDIGSQSGEGGGLIGQDLQIYPHKMESVEIYYLQSKKLQLQFLLQICMNQNIPISIFQKLFLYQIGG
jgi:hypothetical protein